jgi:hypothetical protein
MLYQKYPIKIGRQIVSGLWEGRFEEEDKIWLTTPKYKEKCRKKTKTCNINVYNKKFVSFISIFNFLI